MFRRRRQLAILLYVVALRPPPLAPPRGQRNLDLSTKIVGQTRQSDRWVKRYKQYNNLQVDLENI